MVRPISRSLAVHLAILDENQSMLIDFTNRGVYHRGRSL